MSQVATLRERLGQAIESFSNGSIAVVGDVAIDEMIYGATDRLSREAPVVILRHQRTDVVLGAAGNTAHNLAALGAQVGVIGVCGTDYNAGRLMAAMARDGVSTTDMVPDASRPTTTKTRLSGVANHSVTQQIVRIDAESREPVSKDIEAALINKIEALADTDAVILSDYALGVMTPAVLKAALGLLKRKPAPIIAVDSQQRLDSFQGATLLTPNQPEAERNLGYDLDSPERLAKGGAELLKRTHARAVLITRGAAGMSLFEHDQPVVHIPVFNRSEVFDVTGAGDTVIATMTLALATGATMPEAAMLGNLAASQVVRQFGAATVSPTELKTALDKLPDSVLENTVNACV